MPFDCFCLRTGLPFHVAAKRCLRFHSLAPGVLSILCLAFSCGVFPLAAVAAPVDVRRQDLDVLREQIRKLQQELVQNEGSRDEVSDELASVDKAISVAKRRSREIATQRRSFEVQIGLMQDRQVLLEGELSLLRKNLGETLFSLYVEGGQGGARRFLSGDSPNQLGRDAYYLEQIARQRMALIERARAAMSQLQTLLSELEAKRSELLLLETEARRQQDALLAERVKRQGTLKQISAQVHGQRKQMQGLRNDEARMEKLLKGLERIARSTSSRRPKLAASSPVQSGGVRAPVDAREETVVEENTGKFASAKGRYPWPVDGRLKSRFGSARNDALSSWKGVFISARQGTDVLSIAAGRVAFADWLRGFGNLLIIDHGDGYMSVYGNNESLFKSLGDDVRAGEVIAVAGSSGGPEESGLYFEIRYRGQPQDPAKWMADK